MRRWSIGVDVHQQGTFMVVGYRPAASCTFGLALKAIPNPALISINKSFAPVNTIKSNWAKQ